MYTSAAFAYEDAYLIFPSLYQHWPDNNHSGNDGVLDVRLAASRDPQAQFSYVAGQRAAWLPRGPGVFNRSSWAFAGAFDAAMTYMARGWAPVPAASGAAEWDTIVMMQYGGQLTHGGIDQWWLYHSGQSGIRRVTLRRDGFAALAVAPGNTTATAETLPATLPACAAGQTLTLLVNSQGPVRVSVAGTASQLLQADAVRQPARGLPLVAGRQVSFRFDLLNASSRLYAWELRCEAAQSEAASSPPFARTHQDAAGRWWLRAGNRTFLSLGVDHVSYQGDQDRHTKRSPYEEANDRRYAGNRTRWAQDAMTLVREAQGNTFGAWSDADAMAAASASPESDPFYYTPIIGAGDASLPPGGCFPDVFAPAFRANVATAMAQLVPSRANDTRLLGWYSDNELCWVAAYSEYMKLPATAPGRQVAQAYAGQLGPFLQNVSQTYFSVYRDALRAHDPNHMYLGCKFTSVDSLGDVMVGSRGLVDVHSIDIYAFAPGPSLLAYYFNLSGVPWLIAEFGFRGNTNDSNDPNVQGAGPRLPDQPSRAKAWLSYVQQALALPYVVGLGHFEWVDEPSHGRPDGEDSNYGLVSVNGSVYPDLHSAMALAFHNAIAWHTSPPACPLDRVAYAANQPGALSSQVNNKRRVLVYD